MGGSQKNVEEEGTSTFLGEGRADGGNKTTDQFSFAASTKKGECGPVTLRGIKKTVGEEKREVEIESRKREGGERAVRNMVDCWHGPRCLPKRQSGDYSSPYRLKKKQRAEKKKSRK